MNPFGPNDHHQQKRDHPLHHDDGSRGREAKRIAPRNSIIHSISGCSEMFDDQNNERNAKEYEEKSQPANPKKVASDGHHRHHHHMHRMQQASSDNKMTTAHSSCATPLGVGSRAVGGGNEGDGSGGSRIPMECFEDESSLSRHKKTKKHHCKEGGEKNPAYLSYIEESSSHRLPSPNRNNNSSLLADFEPMAMPTDSSMPPQQQDHRRPGAYAGGPGMTNLQRAPTLRFSLVGSGVVVEPELLGQATMLDDGQEEDSHSSELSQRPRNCCVEGEESSQEDPQQQGQTVANLVEEGSSNHHHPHHHGLVEALPVSTTSLFRSSRRMVAQPVMDNDWNLSHQQSATREARDKKYKRIACSIVAVACPVLLATIGLFLATKRYKESNNNKKADVADIHTTPSLSPTADVLLPPPMMENLQILYNDLPAKTKESLSGSDSPQYQAWEWLHNHPNITAYPEWRKKQIFAMATFFLALEGPNWPPTTPARDRWMDARKSECSWAWSDDAVPFWVAASADSLGSHAYEYEDYYSCNTDGRLQTVIFHQVYLQSTTIQPKFPPEIELLTSLKILGIISSELNTRLANLAVPELLHLPNLEGLYFQNAGLRGTVPPQLGQMTKLRHLPIGANPFTGTIPPQITNMSSLEFFSVSQMTVGPHSSGGETMNNGVIPTEIGRMTSLVGLFIFGTFIGGPIPSQVGLLTRMRGFWLKNNALTGMIPSEIVLMTSLRELHLGNDDFKQLQFQQQSSSLSSQNNHHYNNFSGSLPSKIWELSHLRDMHLPILPNLYSSIPEEILMPNLTMFRINGSPYIAGTIPDQVCLFVDDLDFDCSHLLCGCDCGCTDVEVTRNATNETFLHI